MLDFLISNSWQILQLAIAFACIGLTLFLIPVLIRIFVLLGNVNKLTAEIKSTVELIEGYLWQPARLMFSLKMGFKNTLDIISKFLKK